MTALKKMNATTRRAPAQRQATLLALVPQNIPEGASYGTFWVCRSGKHWLVYSPASAELRRNGAIGRCKHLGEIKLGRRTWYAFDPFAPT